MPTNENANYIWQLDRFRPDGSIDKVYNGDDEIRQLKATILNTFPNITGVVNASHAEINLLVGQTSIGDLLPMNASQFLRSDTDSAPISDAIISLGTTALRFKNIHAQSFTGSLTGNAATASKLAAARTITLSGDVSGSVNFDGSGNVTLNTTVANDSHTHDARYLQLTAKAVDSDKLDGINSTQFLRSDVADTKTSGNLRFNDNIKIEIGSSADITHFFNGTNYYTDINAGANWYLRDANSASAVRFTFDIDTGIGSASGDWQVTSDRRKKEVIGNIPLALSKLRQINGVLYRRKDLPDKEKIHAGVIAQEVQKVLPEVVTTGDDGYLTVSYGSLNALVIEAVKEVADRLQNYEIVIADLVTRLEELEKRCNK